MIVNVPTFCLTSILSTVKHATVNDRQLISQNDIKRITFGGKNTCKNLPFASRKEDMISANAVTVKLKCHKYVSTAKMHLVRDV